MNRPRSSHFWRHLVFWPALLLLGGIALAITQSGPGQAHTHLKEATKSSLILAEGTQVELPGVVLAAYATGLNQPTDIAHTGSLDDVRLFVTEKEGTIRVIDSGGDLLSEPFLNIDGRVQSGAPGTYGFESGLLGLVFDPDYLTNGYFYVNYTYAGDGDEENTGEGDNHISRFQVSAADPNQADPASEEILLTVPQPRPNHNGGDLAFGPDGYLYIAIGDGEGGGDINNNAQNLGLPLGKLLRIDLDAAAGSAPDCVGRGTGNYSVPALNPFSDGPGGSCDEVWALGLRNPWRFSFDRSTGDLFIGDVGEDLQEEIDFQAAGSPGGENYGWHCYEGSLPFLPAACDPPGAYIFPIHEYSHSEGSSVIGGFVYRGTMHAELAGQYFFADYGLPPAYASARLWSLTPDGVSWQVQEHGLHNANFSSFGEDGAGELYLADVTNGIIYLLFYAENQVFLPLVTTGP